MEELFRVEHNITMNLVHCQLVQANSRARPLGTIRISLRSVVEGWYVIQIPRTERYQLGHYVPLCNAPLRSRFIAHIRLETPKAPGVHTYTSIINPSTREPIKSNYIYIYSAKFYLSTGYIHLYFRSTESTLAHKMHDQVDHAGKKPWRKYLFQLA
jgi:hypothetical protein